MTERTYTKTEVLDYLINDEGLVLFSLCRYSKIPPKAGWKTAEQVSVSRLGESFAVRTEGSNLLVVDADRHSDLESEDGVRKIEEYFSGIGYDFMNKGLVVATPNNGLHVYFRLPEGTNVSNATGSTFFGKGVDLRGDGGYIVAPYSKAYDDNRKIRSYEVVSTTLEIPLIPSKLLKDLLSGKASKQKKNTTKGSNTNKTNSQIEEIAGLKLHKKKGRKKAIELKREISPFDSTYEDLLIRDISGSFKKNFVEGKRHSTLNSLSYQLGLMAIPEDLSRKTLKIDSRSIYKGWDEDPDEVFLQGYTDGLKAEISLESLRKARKSWNLSRGKSLFSDPFMEEFYTAQGIAYYIAKKFSDRYIFINRNSLYAFDKETGLWSPVSDSSEIESVIARYLVEKYPEDIAKDYPELLVDKGFSKLTSLSSSSFSFIVRNSVLLMNKEEGRKKILSPDTDLFATKDEAINLKDLSKKKIEASDYLTAKTPIAYRPELLEGPPNEIVECLLSCISEDSREYFLLQVGKAIKAEHSEHIIGLIGAPGIGKTALMDAVSFVLGPYSEIVTPSVFSNYTGRNFERIRLLSKRLVRIEEFTNLDKDSTQDGINFIVGNSQLTGEKKGKDSISFKNTSSVFYTANKLPAIKGSREEGFFRRFVPIICVKGKTYPGNDIKSAFLESPEAQEYLLALIIAHNHELLKEPSKLKALPTSIINSKEEWVSNSSLLGLSSVIEVTGKPEDIVPLKDLTLAYSLAIDSTESDYSLGRKIANTLKGDFYKGKGVALENRKVRKSEIINRHFLSELDEDLSGIKITLVSGVKIKGINTF